MGDQSALILDKLSVNQREAAEARNGERSCDVIVRAGAGSGKTGTLVARYLLLLNNNRDWHPADITAVTFTRKAAREMQSRIRERMLELASDRSVDTEDQAFWLDRLSEMDSACIGTIHSLCGRILRAHPAEAGLDPAFGVLDENEGSLFISEILENLLAEAAAGGEYEPLFRFYTADELMKILSYMIGSRTKVDAAVEVPPENTVTVLREQVRSYLSDPARMQIIGDYLDLQQSPDYEKKAGKLADNIRNLTAVYGKISEEIDRTDHPAELLVKLSAVFDNWNFSEGNKALRAGAKLIREQLAQDYPFLKDTKHDLAWYEDAWKQYDEADSSLRNFWPKVRDTYLQRLKDTDRIDFIGLEEKTLELLRSCPEIRAAWDGKIRALLVDEYQDTNEEQAELFSLLDSSHDRLFAVGDKKQSIYGFRGTNVALFDRRGAEVLAHGGKDIPLDITYRTAPGLLRPMGKLLEAAMADEGLAGKDFYAPYEPMKAPEGQDHRDDGIPQEAPYIDIMLGDLPRDTEGPKSAAVPRMLAGYLTELKAAGMIGKWDEAAILCRKSSEFKAYEEALGAWNIPYVTVAGQGFYDRPEIREVKNMLLAAENPCDDTALSGFLLNPAIGFTSEMLARLYRFADSGSEKRSFRQALADEKFCFEDADRQKILERARTILTELNRIAGQVPVSEVIGELYRLTGYRTALAFDAGDRAWMNLDKLLSDAGNSGKTSVSGFLKYLDVIKEAGTREGEAPSDSDGAVRIMTIHQAKGLQFPVTILAKTDSQRKKHFPLFGIDDKGSSVFLNKHGHPRCEPAVRGTEEKEKAESLRLLYVAATRVKKRLIICGDKPGKNSKSDTWIRRILDALPQECSTCDEFIGPALGEEKPAVRVRRCTSVPEPPLIPVIPAADRESVPVDERLLLPIPEQKADRAPAHTFALTVGKLVHKGLELWHFPNEGPSDGLLRKAMAGILLQTGRLNGAEQQKALRRAEMLLKRFRKSDVFQRAESAERRYHELPFSYMTKSFPVNGVIDLLLLENNIYTVIDFKTDELHTEAQLAEAVDEYARQLNRYRRALQITLNAEPRCEICFLDYCGGVRCIPVGPAAGFADDEPIPADPYDGEDWFPEAIEEPASFDPFGPEY